MRETGGARRLEATLCPVTASIGFICPTISPMMLFIVRWVMRQLKRSRSLRLEQIKASLTASMTRPGPADTRNRFPLSTRVLGWPGPASYSRPCFAEKLGPAWAWALAGQESPDTSVSGQSLGWAETWDWDILDKRIIARSQSIEAVTSNWSIIDPAEKGGVGRSAGTLPSLRTWPNCALVS